MKQGSVNEKLFLFENRNVGKNVNIAVAYMDLN
jgi:hypothetical protein